MKQLVILYGEDCGYCKKAKMLVRRALEKEPKYLALNIQFVSDQSNAGKGYAHTLVPAFFCNGKLYFEGNPDMDTITTVLQDCYKF